MESLGYLPARKTPERASLIDAGILVLESRRADFRLAFVKNATALTAPGAVALFANNDASKSIEIHGIRAEEAGILDVFLKWPPSLGSMGLHSGGSDQAVEYLIILGEGVFPFQLREDLHELVPLRQFTIHITSMLAATVLEVGWKWQGIEVPHLNVHFSSPGTTQRVEFHAPTDNVRFWCRQKDAMGKVSLRREFAIDSSETSVTVAR